MFDNLTQHLETVFKKLRGQGKLSEDNIREAMRDIRRALLEADVNYKVAKDFVEKVTARAAGTEVLQSITPGQQVVKVVYDELVELLGRTSAETVFRGSPPYKVMLVGLQGSGKTTLCAKLALHFRKKGYQPLLVAADVYRPAAIEQLETLGRSLSIQVFAGDRKNPLSICRDAVDYAKKENLNLILIDTAGRLHVDEEMMVEAEKIASQEKPQEIFFAADAMTGQDAVNAAAAFHSRLHFTGVVLTKLDGDARGGAALSVLAVTGTPIRYVGVGEKPDQLELFHPDRMASRLLGMGDVVSLVEKAQENFDASKSRDLERKMLKAQFTFEDFRDQLRQIKKMGSLTDLLGMLPGMGGQIKEMDTAANEKELGKIEAIINSMTKKERVRPVIIDGSRRKRIAGGSGTTVTDVNRLLKQFDEMQRMMKSMGKMMGKMKGGLRGAASRLNLGIPH
ncbi:MAG: signal recognition particle protein [Fibrobacterota bacterium]